jgi:hypothetical protein
MAMKKKRITRTTIEAHEVYILKTPRQPKPVLCARCRGQVALISLEEAVRLTVASSRTIHRWVETGDLHFAETAEGLMLLCPASLLQHLHKQNLVRLVER